MLNVSPWNTRARSGRCNVIFFFVSQAGHTSSLCSPSSVHAWGEGAFALLHSPSICSKQACASFWCRCCSGTYCLIARQRRGAVMPEVLDLAVSPSEVSLAQTVSFVLTRQPEHNKCISTHHLLTLSAPAALCTYTTPAEVACRYSQLCWQSCGQLRRSSFSVWRGELHYAIEQHLLMVFCEEVPNFPQTRASLPVNVSSQLTL